MSFRKKKNDRKKTATLKCTCTKIKTPNKRKKIGFSCSCPHTLYAVLESIRLPFSSISFSSILLSSFFLHITVEKCCSFLPSFFFSHCRVQHKQIECIICSLHTYKTVHLLYYSSAFIYSAGMRFPFTQHIRSAFGTGVLSERMLYFLRFYYVVFFFSFNCINLLVFAYIKLFVVMHFFALLSLSTFFFFNLPLPFFYLFFAMYVSVLHHILFNVYICIERKDMKREKIECITREWAKGKKGATATGREKKMVLKKT